MRTLGLRTGLLLAAAIVAVLPLGCAQRRPPRLYNYDLLVRESFSSMAQTHVFELPIYYQTAEGKRVLVSPYVNTRREMRFAPRPVFVGERTSYLLYYHDLQHQGVGTYQQLHRQFLIYRQGVLVR